MGLFDALTIAGGGVARGFRQSQEIQRQLAELKTRQLLEQQRLDLVGEQSRSEIALNALRGQTEGAQREHYLGQEKRESEASTASHAPLAAGSRGAYLLGEMGLPNQAGNFGAIDNILQAREQDKFMTDHPDFYQRFKPPVSEENQDINDTLKLILDAMGPLTQLETADPAGAMKKRFDAALELLPTGITKISELRKKHKGAASNSSGVRKDPNEERIRKALGK